MIILRYLSRELLQTTVAVTVILMIIIMSGRFVKYLADVAQGKLDANVVLAILFFRIPGFVELILPLGFFIAILLAYGRLYAEHEMTILFASGISRQQVLMMTCVPAIVLMIVIAACSLWLTPVGIAKVETIFQQQKQRSSLDALQAGNFQTSKSGELVYFAQKQNSQGELEDVFIATSDPRDTEVMVTIKAEKAIQTSPNTVDNPNGQPSYLTLINGVRYEGTPGEKNFRITQFERLHKYIASKPVEVISSPKIDGLSTPKLIQSNATPLNVNESKRLAALHWRFSTPLIIIVITLLGVTMSHTSPRRGRYAMLFPAIVLYLLYLVVLNAARDGIEEESISPQLGLWGIHGLFFISALLFFSYRNGAGKLKVVKAASKNA